MTRGKKSILVVALVLALCAAMLFGATVAWFTSSVNTGTNTIKVDDYKVNLQYTDSMSGESVAWTDLSTSSQLFTGDTVLKPGDKTGVKYIKITNNNKYPIKATVDIGTIAQAIGENSSPDVKETDKLNLYALTSNVTGSNDNLAKQTAGESGKYTLTIDNIAAATTEDSTTTPGTAIIAIQFELPEDAVTPSVNNTFTINVTTTQEHTESESNG